MNETLESDYRELRAICFPAFRGRQKYMHSFNTRDPHMPSGYEEYLPPVMQLFRASGFGDRAVHVTVDEKLIQPGQSQRRPGPHVDGCFMPQAMSWGNGGGWNHNCNIIPGGLKRMAIIVAASVAGCRAWRGTFSGGPKDDGDCSHIVTGRGEILPANMGYLLSPDCIHESMPFTEPTERQFLRIAFAV